MTDWLTLDPDELDDLRAEFAPRRRRLIACSDRMCGAQDCPSCYPEGPTQEEEPSTESEI